MIIYLILLYSPSMSSKPCPQVNSPLPRIGARMILIWGWTLRAIEGTVAIWLHKILMCVKKASQDTMLINLGDQ